MDQVDVVWKSYHEPEIIARGYWDQGLLEEFFSGPNYSHHTEFDEVAGGAVVVINGRTHVDDVPQLNKDLANLSWCLLMVTGDEEALFPWRTVQNVLMRRWIQMPRNEHEHEHLLPNGYRPQTRRLLREIKRPVRTNDWMFAGQANHPVRQECVDALRQMSGGLLIETEGFGRENLPYPDYVACMSVTRVMPCPSGVSTPDTFRVYEALEAGCIPVVDAYSDHFNDHRFWARVLPGVDLPMVYNWAEFPAVCEMLTADWTWHSNRIFSQWLNYKYDLQMRIERDIRDLWRP